MLPLFGFSKEPDLFGSPNLVKHGRGVITRLSLAVEDFDGVQEYFVELGGRHQHYGMLIEHFPVMKEAVIRLLKGVLGPKFTPSHHSAWDRVLDAIFVEMKKGMGVLG